MAEVVLTDIEGTIADIDFVRKILFPYARERLPAFVRRHAQQADVAAQLDATAAQADLPRHDLAALVEQLLRWIDQDVKATPLKALQGMIWKAGYVDADFAGHLYPDARLQLQAWHEAGVPLYVYSSGSIQAQQLYFQYSDCGDVRRWFSGFFDTTSGPKKEAESYRRIASVIGQDPGAILFLSDVVEELDAAREAGMATAQICRPGNQAYGQHLRYASLAELPALGDC
ncbi:MAG: acireductone synthase [Wenzhouxiangella sp.]|nr:acireductone synthase [Wenzhouxiangella sp.]